MNLHNLHNNFEAQRPEIGVADVQASDFFQATPEMYPWITAEKQVTTVLVTMVDGTELRFGSLIGLNPTIAKIASAVPKSASAKAEESLFMALPFVLRGETHPSVHNVDVKNTETDLLKIGKRHGPDAARLVVAVHGEGDTPVVLRAAILRHKDQPRVNALMKADKHSRMPNKRR